MKTPKRNWRIRPLTDRVRAALFNILGEKAVGSNFLDVFAGTGAVGIEALSRGAKTARFVELSRPAVSLIRENLRITGFTACAEVYALDAVRALNLFSGRGAKFEVIFLGAPYDSPVLEKVMDKIADTEVLEDDGVMIAEHRKQHALAENVGKLERFREARYGETVLAFYRVKK